MGEGVFTSNLSVAEFAIGNQMRLEPLTQVMGSCVYQVGWQYAGQALRSFGTAVFQELEVITGAWNEARSAAISRMASEARRVGADAVAGVTVRTSQDWAADSVEFVVTGTALRDPDAKPGHEPALSDLSLQDYWKLREAGIEPCGLVAATSCFFVVRGAWSAQMQMLTFNRNQEIPEYSQGVYAARETALGRVTEQIKDAGGDGVVGMNISHTIGEREFKTYRGGSAVQGLVVTFHAMGTAVRTPQPPVATHPLETAIDLST